MNYKGIILATFILILAFQEIVGQTARETRILEKSFPVTGEMSLEVTNKYGKVHLSGTKSDSVNIRIEMNASAPNQAKLRKLIDGVSFELNSTNYFIIAETRFLKGPGNLFESIRSITNNLISSESRLEINYFVEVPDYIDVKIDNRYGDVYIESLKCDLDIRMSNGSLKAEDLTGNNFFDLSFYDATIASCSRTKMNLSYGELKITESGDLNITSSSSRLEIDRTVSLRIDSRRDKYFINQITDIEGEGYFTELNIEKLANSAALKTKYGSLRVESLDPEFVLFSVDSDYTSVELETHQGLSFNIDIKAVNCPVNIPEKWNIEEKEIGEEGKEYLYYGRTGHNESDAQVKINCSRGKVFLFEK